MKRFVETGDWRDPRYRRLSPQAKHLRRYLWDNCDCAGVIAVDYEAVSFHVGEPIEEKHLTELGNWAETLKDGRLLIPSFIHFQSGELSDACRAHLPILKTIRAHNLVRVRELYHQSPDSLSGDQPLLLDRGQLQLKEQLKDKDKEKEQDKERVQGPAHQVLDFLNTQTGRSYRPTDSNLKFIQSRLVESGVTIDGVKQMICRQCARWKGTDQAEYLRPETLFNKTKFDAYYAAKDLPTHETDQRNRSANATRTTGADQRKVGIPETKRDGKLSDLLAERARKATANTLATKASPPERSQSGGSTHG